MNAEKPPVATPPPHLVGVLDIGAHAARLVVAQSGATGPETIENISQPVPLAAALADGRVSHDGQEALIRILAGYRKILDQYGVVRIRAVATSALRDTDNREILLDRIRQATGFRVEVIDEVEEMRLLLRIVPVPPKGIHLLLKLGAGTIEILELQRGLVAQFLNYRMGTRRIVEMTSGLGSPAEVRRALARLARKAASEIRRTIRLANATSLAAVGDDVRRIAKIVAKKGKAGRDGGGRIGRSDVAKLAERLSEMSVEERVKAYDLPYDSAETILPAAFILDFLFQEAEVSRIEIPENSIRDGIVQELLAPPDAKGARGLDSHIRHSAVHLGRRYGFDEPHAKFSAEAVGRIFDAVAALPEAELGPRDRLLLEVAAILHDIGFFISSRQHHKHSFHLIDATEIFGLSPEDRRLVALIARYHRRAHPRIQHPEYAALAVEDRIRVGKLAGILRIAESLDVAHDQRLDGFAARVEKRNLYLSPPPKTESSLERLPLKRRSGLLRETLGLETTLGM